MRYLQPPHPTTIASVRRRLAELNLYFDDDAIAVISAATTEWMTATTEGKQFLVDRIGCDIEEGRSDVEYRILSTGERVSGDRIYFLKTVVVKGEFLPPSEVDSEPIDKVTCARCYALTHCTRDVPEQNGTYVSVCNHCLFLEENPRWNQKSGGSKECEQCTVVLCPHQIQRSPVAAVI